MDKTKYNVDKDIAKRSCNGIVFDSIMEMRYYREVVLPKKESGEIVSYELQKKYILQEGFVHHGRRVLPIVYVADFYIVYADGTEQVIDVKGCPDTTAKIKRKLFWLRYPDIDYQWVTYIKRLGGWGNYDDYKRIKSAEKRSKTIKNKEEKGE